MKKKISTFGIFWENIEYGGMASHLVDLLNSDTFKVLNLQYLQIKITLD